MPLDTSLYPLTHLRPDGRRWNELRRLHAQVSTNTAADGSSYLEMGNTKVLCIISGPSESRSGGGGGGGGGGRQQQREGPQRENAAIVVEINQAGFAGVERKRRGKGDRRVTELQNVVAGAMGTAVFGHLYPHSTIGVTLHVLSLDGGLLAACLNAATLAMIDAGVPMKDYVSACTCGLSPLAPSALRGNSDTQDPLLDLNTMEEQELPFLTVATLGGEGDKVVVLSMERRVRVENMESILATGVDGCKRVRGLLDQVIRERGARVIADSGGG